MPAPSVATVRTMAGLRPLARLSMAETSRSTRSAPGWSALLMAKTSAISMMPALIACTSSPMPGTSTTTVTCARPAISTSSCPTPTVSMRTKSLPAASSRRAMSAGGAGQAAERAARGHGADEDAGVGVVLLHADAVAEDGAAGDAAARDRRPRSPPCCLPARSARASASTSVLLPAPGAPVMPDHHGPAVCGSSSSAASASGSRFSMPVAARASARASPSAIRRASSRISFSGVAARSRAAGSRSCPRRWCRA